MRDLTQYINKRKSRDPAFAKDFDSGHELFKRGILSKRTRTKANTGIAKKYHKIH